MIRALLVDDHRLFIEGVTAMFRQEDGVAIAHSTQNGNEVPSLLREHKVDVVLLDISMPIIDGLGVLKLIQEEGHMVPVLMLTMHAGMKELRQALSLGVGGYVLKDATKAELLEAITAVANGQNYFHRKIQQQMLDYFRGKKSTSEAQNQLSERELEIIREIANGGTSKDIAERLFLSDHTVRTHRRNILHKLGIHNTAELIHMAMENGWV